LNDIRRRARKNPATARGHCSVEDRPPRRRRGHPPSAAKRARERSIVRRDRATTRQRGDPCAFLTRRSRSTSQTRRSRA
jgi:hypothetical protein